MGFFDFAKICLFSEVDGVVTLNGKPLPGAEVVRTSEIGKDSVHTDRTFTDNQGRYFFPARFSHSLRKISPIEPLILQKIVIRFEAAEYVGWKTDKRNYDVNGELGRAIRLTCELSNESARKEFGSQIVWGICDIG